MTDKKAVFSVDTGKLDATQLRELQDKFGLQLHLEARSDALEKVLSRIGDVMVQNFDRTNPGYERIFDRTGASELERGANVINPVDLEDRIRGVAHRILEERNRPR